MCITVTLLVGYLFIIITTTTAISQTYKKFKDTN